MEKYTSVMSLLLALLFLLAGCAGEDSEKRDPAEVIAGENPCDIYFATGNDYYDLYVGYSWVPGPEITLLTRECIDPETISVSLNIQADYTVHVTQQETGTALTSYEIKEGDGTREVTTASASAYDFPLYIYQNYAGMDWAGVSAAYTEYYATVEKYENGEADTEQVKAALAAYNYIATEYVSDYAELKLEDIPQIYQYLIQITIDDAAAEETFTTVQVTIGDTVYDVDIGQVKIRPNPGYSEAMQYLSVCSSAPLWLVSYPFGVGIEECQTDTYYVEKPLTLTGLHFWENTMSTVEILDVTVVLSDSEEGVLERSGIEIKWDGKTPIYMEQGKYMGLYFTVQDERMKEVNYHSSLYPVLEFACDGSDLDLGSEIPLYRHYSDSWLLYTIGLDGMDMESYFNDYYYVVVSNWRNEVEQSTWGSKG